MCELSCVQFVYVMSSLDVTESMMVSIKQNAQKTKWVQKCMNVNYPHYCQLIDMKDDLKMMEMRDDLKSMAAVQLASAKEEEQYQKRKVKDDVCKDCDKIHSTPLTSHICEYCA